AASRFNQHIVGPLLEGAYEALVENGVSEHTIEVVRVPGAFELPVTAMRLAQSGRFDAVVCLGAVVRGDTPHFEFVSGECARGLMEAGLMTGKPVIFGVLTTNTEQQALDRAGGSEGNKGAEAALAALETLNALRAAGA
ncbi:MAG: 6,7-dimethyl-8-ribityllumazine synthase, partial [Gammaproteobacteria bacterium]